MPTDQEIHDKWSEMTSGGVGDSRVADIEKRFREHRDWLRSRYNTSADTLRALDAVCDKACAQAKRDIVMSVPL